MSLAAEQSILLLLIGAGLIYPIIQLVNDGHVTFGGFVVSFLTALFIFTFFYAPWYTVVGGIICFVVFYAFCFSKSFVDSLTGTGFSVFIFIFLAIGILQSYNNRVREVAVGTGIISTIAGNGTAGYSGDNAPAISAELNSPTSVAVDLEGNIYIADDVNNRIRKVTAGNISTVTGNGTAGFSGDGKIATSGEVNAPWGIAVDSKGALYIADIGNSVIRMISDNTYFPSTAVGATSASQSILLETTSALNITGISVPVSQGSKQEFNVGTVSGCTVDSTGNTQTASGIVCTVAVSFSPGYPGLRQSPIQVSTVSSGVTVVYPIGINGVGTSPLAAFMPGTVNTVAGTGTSGNSGDGAVATSAQLSSPNGVALDGAGNLFVADTGNHRIRKVSASTGYISTVRPATA